MTFLLVNLEGVDKAKSYADSKGLTGGCLHGAAAAPGDSYKVQYIPHKCIVGTDGKIVSNYKKKDGGAIAFTDVDALL